MASSVDSVSCNATKAQKAMVAAIKELIMNDEKAQAKKIYDIGTQIWEDDFVGMNEKYNNTLEGVTAAIVAKGLDASEAQKTLQNLIKAQDIVEQAMDTDNANKIEELIRFVFGDEVYKKARLEHVAKPVKERNEKIE